MMLEVTSLLEDVAQRSGKSLGACLAFLALVSASALCVYGGCMEDEPEPNVRVVYVGGMPKLDVNDQLVDPEFNLIHRESGDISFFKSQLRRFADIGIHQHALYSHPATFWKDDGTGDFDAIDTEARRLLELDPDARFILTLKLTMPDWCRNHPSEMIAYADGEGKGDHEESGAPLRASAASIPYREEVDRVFAALAEYLKDKPWRKRLIAIRPCWGIYGEWHTFGMGNCPDVSEPMVKAFRRYADGKYAGANPPTPAERTSGGVILDPVANRKAIDYFNCMQLEVVGLMHSMARSVKRHLPGRLVGFYYGYVIVPQHPEGATVLVDQVLSSPDVDFLCDPPDYKEVSRRAGGSFYHRTIPSMFIRRGKLLILEEDTRYHHVKEWVLPRSYYCHDEVESRAVMLRNCWNCLFDRCGIQFLDAIMGKGERPFAFDNDIVMSAYADARRAAAKALPLSAASGCPIALVVSPANRFVTDLKSETGRKAALQVYRTLPHAMHSSGFAFDTLEFGDWLAETNAYRTVVFLNQFVCSKTAERRILDRLARDGAKAVWVAPDGTLEARGAIAESREIRDGFDMAKVLLALGETPMATPGGSVRRCGDLVLYHVKDNGEHELNVGSGEWGGTAVGCSSQGACCSFEVGRPSNLAVEEDFQLKRRR